VIKANGGKASRKVFLPDRSPRDEKMLSSKWHPFAGLDGYFLKVIRQFSLDSLIAIPKHPFRCKLYIIQMCIYIYTHVRIYVCVCICIFTKGVAHIFMYVKDESCQVSVQIDRCVTVVLSFTFIPPTSLDFVYIKL